MSGQISSLDESAVPLFSSSKSLRMSDTSVASDVEDKRLSSLAKDFFCERILERSSAVSCEDVLAKGTDSGLGFCGAAL